MPVCQSERRAEDAPGACALVLLSDPQICCLLDEPTNHLDVEMLEWLENWLKRISIGRNDRFS